MEQTETKAWYLSKSILGSILAILSVIAGFFGYQIDAATQAVVLDQVQAAASAVGVLVGAATAIWGRVVATKKLAA